MATARSWNGGRHLNATSITPLSGLHFSVVHLPAGWSLSGVTFTRERHTGSSGNLMAVGSPADKTAGFCDRSFNDFGGR